MMVQAWVKGSCSGPSRRWARVSSAAASMRTRSAGVSDWACVLMWVRLNASRAKAISAVADSSRQSGTARRWLNHPVDDAIRSDSGTEELNLMCGGSNVGATGKDVCVARRAAVAVVMVVVVCVLFWAGWHNLRSRRLAMQQAQQAQITVQKDNSSEGMPDTAITTNLIGKTAPGFTLVDLSGKKVSLADYKGKPVVVNFWATYCVPCQEEMPWFEEFTKKYAAQNLVVLGLNLEDGVTKDTVQKASRRVGVTYPILFADDKVGASYGVGDYLPVTVYVGKDGTVTEQTPGAPSKDEMEAHIRKITGAM